ADLDQAELLQPAQRLTHRMPVHLERRRELALTRQACIGLVRPADDRIPQLREHMVGHVATRSRRQCHQVTVSHTNWLDQQQSWWSGEGTGAVLTRIATLMRSAVPTEAPDGRSYVA